MLKRFFASLTPEASRARANRVYQRLMGTDAPLPMPHKRATYILEHVVVRWQKNTVRVHLHGHKYGWFIASKRIEYVTLNRVENMTEEEAVRVAAFMSPNKWVVALSTKAGRYKRHLNQPLDARLQAALTDPRNISVSDG